MNLRAARSTFRVLALALLTTAFLAGCVNSDTPPWTGPAQSPKTGASAPSDDQSREARKTATRFLRSFVDRDFDGLWGMLRGDTQARLGNKEAFGGFLQRKFGSGDLSYELGDPQASSQSAAISVPITLDLGDSGGRVAGPPLVLVPQGE